VQLVTNLDGKSRGYAFIEFEKEESMTSAYKRADGKKLDGRRIVVDVERGRTVRNWRPRRLGGGLGGRKAKKSKKVHSLCFHVFSLCLNLNATFFCRIWSWRQRNLLKLLALLVQEAAVSMEVLRHHVRLNESPMTLVE